MFLLVYKLVSPIPGSIFDPGSSAGTVTLKSEGFEAARSEAADFVKMLRETHQVFGFHSKFEILTLLEVSKAQDLLGEMAT